MEQDLKATNAEFENGQRVEFSVPEALIGLVIGKAGANVNKVKELTGVDRIVVDTKTRAVRIRGGDPAQVKRARGMLEFQETVLPIDMSQVGSVIGEKGKNLTDVWKKSGCIHVNLETGNNAEQRFLRLVGTKQSVQLAQDLIETQLEFQKRLFGLKQEELTIKKQLDRIDSEFRENTTSFGEPRKWSSDDHSHYRKVEPKPEVKPSKNDIKPTETKKLPFENQKKKKDDRVTQFENSTAKKNKKQTVEVKKNEKKDKKSDQVKANHNSGDAKNEKAAGIRDPPKKVVDSTPVVIDVGQTDAPIETPVATEQQAANKKKKRPFRRNKKPVSNVESN